MSEHFSRTYREARERFRSAAAAARPNTDSAGSVAHRNTAITGPDGGPLCTDVAWLGPADAADVVMIVSGTHGVEGYTGSACQLALLCGDLLSAVPDDTALLLVHALNPFGFAWDRRVNEDNVDLNRNFVDHRHPPHNATYAEVHDALVPADWFGDARQTADTALLTLAATQGTPYLQSAITAGQWTHPDGLFYGGDRPVWSNGVLREVATTHLAACRRVAYLDLHTGLGERGAGEPIFRGGRDAGSHERARRWYGERLTRSENGTSSSTPIVGNSAGLITEALREDQELTAITLEFGTLPGLEVLAALRADNWLNLQHDAPPDVSAAIKDQIRNAFCPPDTDWRDTVLSRAREVLDQTLVGLART